MTTYVFTLSSDDDNVDEVAAEIEGDEVTLELRIVEGDDEPVIFEFRLTPDGIEPLDA